MTNIVNEEGNERYDVERILVDPYNHYAIDMFTIQELAACCYDAGSSRRFFQELANWINIVNKSFLNVMLGEGSKINESNLPKYIPSIQLVPFAVGDKRMYVGNTMLGALTNPKGLEVSSDRNIDYSDDQSVEILRNEIKNKMNSLSVTIAKEMKIFAYYNNCIDDRDVLFDEFTRTLDIELIKRFFNNPFDSEERGRISIHEVLRDLVKNLDLYLNCEDKDLSFSTEESLRNLKKKIENGHVKFEIIADVVEKLRKESESSSEDRTKIDDIINCLSYSLTRCRMMELVAGIRDKFDRLSSEKQPLTLAHEKSRIQNSVDMVENSYSLLRLYQEYYNAGEIVSNLRTVLAYEIFSEIDPAKLAIIKANKYIRDYDALFEIVKNSFGDKFENNTNIVSERFSRIFPYIVDYFVSFKDYLGNSPDIRINVKYPNGKKDVIRLSKVLADIDRIQRECPYGVNMGDMRQFVGKSIDEVEDIRDEFVEISKLQKDIEEQMLSEQRVESILANTEEFYAEIEAFNREEAVKDQEDEIDLLYQQARSAEVLENSREYWADVDAYIKEQEALDKEDELYEQYQKKLEDDEKFGAEWESLLLEEEKVLEQKRLEEKARFDAEWAELMAVEMKKRLAKSAKLLVKIGAAIFIPGESTNDTLRANNDRQWGKIDDIASRIKMEKLEDRQRFYMDELNYVGMIVANDQVIYVEPSGYCYMEPANQSDIGKAAVYYGHYTDMYDLIAKFAAERHLVKEELREDTRNGKRNILWIRHNESYDDDGNLVSEPWKDKVRAIEASASEEKRDVDAITSFIENVDNMLKQTASERELSGAKKKIGSKPNRRNKKS